MTPATLSTAMQETALRYSQGYPVNFDEEARKVMEAMPNDEIEALFREYEVDPNSAWGAICAQFFLRGIALHRPEQAERIADLVSSLECEKRMRKDAEEAMETVFEAAEEWAQYVEVDTAPMTLPAYLARAVAATKGESK